MPDPLRVVVDTNVFISALLRPRSTPRQTVDHVLSQGRLLLSTSTATELNDVLLRPKFDRYVSTRLRLEFIAAVIHHSELIVIDQSISACRDVCDNHFLELAICGRAGFIISGDQDLLVLNPFRGVQVLTPGEFLRHVLI